MPSSPPLPGHKQWQNKPLSFENPRHFADFSMDNSRKIADDIDIMNKIA